MTDRPPVQPEAAKRPKTEYARKLLREFGTSTKLGGAGLLGIAATEWFSHEEASAQSAEWLILLLIVGGIILAIMGNLLTAEAER